MLQEIKNMMKQAGVGVMQKVQRVTRLSAFADELGRFRKMYWEDRESTGLANAICLGGKAIGGSRFSK